jgi:hypothetical protein
MTHHLGSGLVARTTGLSPRHNLTVQPTPLLGRERQIEMARQHVLAEDPPVRLLTLTGPGGTGKTRLALEIAQTLVDHFEEGVFVVDLASIRDAQFVTSAIVRTLRLQAAGDQSPFDCLLDFLAPPACVTDP